MNYTNEENMNHINEESMNHINEERKLLLMQQIYTTFMSLAKKLNTQNNKHSSELTTRQYMVILTIRHLLQNETNMVNIAKKLGSTKQNINQLISVLEKKGYVSKAVCEKNKRMIIIKVTDAGLNAMMTHVKTTVPFTTNIFLGFTEKELETLLQLLQKLNAYKNIRKT